MLPLCESSSSGPGSRGARGFDPLPTRVTGFGVAAARPGLGEMTGSGVVPPPPSPSSNRNASPVLIADRHTLGDTLDLGYSKGVEPQRAGGSASGGPDPRSPAPR